MVMQLAMPHTLQFRVCMSVCAFVHIMHIVYVSHTFPWDGFQDSEISETPKSTRPFPDFQGYLFPSHSWWCR